MPISVRASPHKIWLSTFSIFNVKKLNRSKCLETFHMH